MHALPRGILPPIVTPFRDGALALDSFAHNLRLWNGTGLAGYLVAGSNGEGALLADDEVIALVEAARPLVPPGKALLAGTGRESTARTIELTRRAARAGAEGVLVVPPSYYRAWMTDAVLERHYRAVADASEVPVLLYHVPKFSPVSFTDRLIRSLAAHPNIGGIKETSGDVTLLATVLKERPPSFRVYIGMGSLLHAGLLLGADGGIVALANVAPRECVEVAHSIAAGRIEEARALQFRLLALNHAVTGGHGIAGLKHALEVLGFRTGPPRPPLLPLDEKGTREVEAALAEAGLAPAAR